MTDCHIINPPLTQITNQCLPRHHLFPNTNPNPNPSFSLFRTNPLRNRHTLQPPHSVVVVLHGRPSTSNYRCSSSNVDPVAPSPETTTTVTLPAARTYISRASHHLLARIVMLDVAATRNHHLCTCTFHHCSTTRCNSPRPLAPPPSRSRRQQQPRRHSHIEPPLRTKTTHALQHHYDAVATHRSSRASSSSCIPQTPPRPVVVSLSRDHHRVSRT
ncbi:hypothetical protein DEO72_LG10g1461 [Vigna unguiculata]|uniref:Uncharacterized protein n=1 Tax=Vigna unguiculata TaxID=3917 RepID=A0A4D6N8S0_VIGUN|nr:hypothetical protein DEO72_LG10g1460 [Vigna unguiculata]QCE10233.1 hypothetical protein DEO72_LG10g1461 [Vigna unguiculata]